MENKRVCVIDDEQIVLDSVRKILEPENFLIDLFRSSREGLNAALSGPYDLVLTDIRMPEIGGMRILRDIRRKRPKMPVIMITGYSTVENAVQAIKLGAAEYIEKPFTPDYLLEKVSGALVRDSSEVSENTELVNKSELLKVLDRAAKDYEFAGKLFYQGADALSGYTLTEHEKLAVLTGDIAWIESYTGRLDAERRKWLEQRLCSEIW